MSVRKRALQVSVLCLSVLCLSVVAAEDEATVFTPAIVELPSVDLGNGWTRWDGIGDVEGVVSYRVRVTSLHLGPDGSVLVGTSRGLLLGFESGSWSELARINGVQITGIAADDGDLWLSTSDGMCRLQRTEDNDSGVSKWTLKQDRHYHQGHPSFVSGAYLPGEDAHRLWGYVDDVFLPKRIDEHGPFAISTEHGLFHKSSHTPWHHFLPHYWGANSAWLDLRELIPHRRPTCMAEDREGNLWIGSESDGIIRMNAHAREYSNREPADNAQDGTEFTHFRADELGVDLRRVNDIVPGLESDVWAALVGSDKRRYLGRFDGREWSHFELPQIKRRTFRGQQLIKTNWWEGTPVAVAQVAPGRVFVGARELAWPAGLLEWSVETGKFAPVPEVSGAVEEIARTDDGAVWLRTDWAVYHRAASPSP